MLPRAALHQENVISNEQLNRQRVEAGQIAPIFSVSTWLKGACGPLAGVTPRIGTKGQIGF